MKLKKIQVKAFNKLIKFKKLNPGFGRRVLVRNNNLFNSTSLTPSPFVFGDTENPANIASIITRRYAYIDSYTLESPRITPRQMNRTRGRGTNTQHTISSEGSYFEDIPFTQPTQIEDNIITMSPTTPLYNDGINLSNTVVDESISVDGTEIDTVGTNSPLNSIDIRRELNELRNSLSETLTESSANEVTNQILEQANQVIRQFDELHNENSDDSDDENGEADTNEADMNESDDNEDDDEDDNEDDNEDEDIEQ